MFPVVRGIVLIRNCIQKLPVVQVIPYRVLFFAVRIVPRFVSHGLEIIVPSVLLICVNLIPPLRQVHLPAQLICTVPPLINRFQRLIDLLADFVNLRLWSSFPQGLFPFFLQLCKLTFLHAVRVTVYGFLQRLKLFRAHSRDLFLAGHGKCAVLFLNPAVRCDQICKILAGLILFPCRFRIPDRGFYHLGISFQIPELTFCLFQLFFRCQIIILGFFKITIRHSVVIFLRPLVRQISCFVFILRPGFFILHHALKDFICFPLFMRSCSPFRICRLFVLHGGIHSRLRILLPAERPCALRNLQLSHPCVFIRHLRGCQLQQLLIQAAPFFLSAGSQDIFALLSLTEKLPFLPLRG